MLSADGILWRKHLIYDIEPLKPYLIKIMKSDLKPTEVSKSYIYKFCTRFNELLIHIL